MPYTLSDARDRFYSWAACRAAQAGSAKAKRSELFDALRDSGVTRYLRGVHKPNLTSQQFDKHFYNWVEKAATCLRKKHHRQVSFGIAAKLISVYLKGAWVLHHPEYCPLSRHMHPPIDSRLLAAIDECKGTKFSKNYKWQKLDRGKYRELVEQLRSLNGAKPFWQLEEYWHP